MKLGILFSGGKDSTYAAFLAKKYGHELACLISLISENPDSYMFHTPAISLTAQQAALMKIPLLQQETAGEKEAELGDLKAALQQAKEQYGIAGLVTGAVASVYQATRVQKICAELDLHVFNPLWQKGQIELLEELLENGFEVVISAVAAAPLDATWVGRKIDPGFIAEVKELERKFRINPAGEGGEFETLVLNCPLFAQELQLGKTRTVGSGNSFRLEVEE